MLSGVLMSSLLEGMRERGGGGGGEREGGGEDREGERGGKKGR